MTSRSTTLENLPADTSYQVQVRAVSDVGAGPYSDVLTQITHRGMNVTTAFDVVRSLNSFVHKFLPIYICAIYIIYRIECNSF